MTITLAQVITITLLGTGSPEPAVDRFGPATLVQAGEQVFLFDAGRGVTQRLWQREIGLGPVTQVFVTHLHSDHVVGLPDLWLSGWQRTAFGQRRAPLEVWGPSGTAAMTSGLRQAYAEDVRSRNAVAPLPDSATALVGHDVTEGVIYDHGGVRVTAFAVDHGTPPIAALGYRLDAGGRSVVISGDTRPSENLIRYARGADVLIHEVMAAEPGAPAAGRRRRLLESHTSPEDAGAVFARVKPRLAVYTHVSLVTAVERRPALLQSLVSRTRAAYSGRLEVGEDLMSILVGDTIEVRRRP